MLLLLKIISREIKLQSSWQSWIRCWMARVPSFSIPEWFNNYQHVKIDKRNKHAIAVSSTLQALHRFLTALKTSKNPLRFLAEKMETQRFSSLFPKAARVSIEPKSGLAAPTSFPAKRDAGGSRCWADSISEVVHLLPILITHLPSSINPGTANLTFWSQMFSVTSLTCPSCH